VRYIRQEIFEPIGTEGQHKISAASAAIVGCGALGTNIANNLARSGVGRLRIIDRDFVELDNLQRQVLFDEDDVRRRMPKAAAAVEHLRRANSVIRLEAEVCEISSANIARLIAGCNVVMDGTDNVEARLLLNDACLASATPCVFAGAVGATAVTMTLVPGQTPCYRCLMPELPAPGTTPTASTAGILHSTTAVVAALQCTAALRLLIGAFEPSDEVLCVDVWDRELTRRRLPRRPDCPACAHHRYEFLNAAPVERDTAPPGTNSVRLAGRLDADPGCLAEAWRGAGTVVLNDWLVSLRVGEHEVIVFRDGRCIVKGTADPAAARSILNRLLSLAR